LDPRDTYADVADWNAKAADLGARFVKNFAQYTDNEQGQSLVKAGPQV
jgi:phosphoenolpyruvate carboxykinase (ATP)